MPPKPTPPPTPQPPLRWYSSAAAEPETLQVKFVSVPHDRLEDLLKAVATVFPDLRRY